MPIVAIEYWGCRSLNKYILFNPHLNKYFFLFLAFHQKMCKIRCSCLLPPNVHSSSISAHAESSEFQHLRNSSIIRLFLFKTFIIGCSSFDFSCSCSSTIEVCRNRLENAVSPTNTCKTRITATISSRAL